MTGRGKKTRRERRPRRRWRTWLRAALGTVAVVCLLGGFCLWLFTRSWFIAGRIEPVLARLLGGEVAIARAEYRGGGRFLLSDVQLRVPGWSGPAGEVCRVGRADVVLDMDALLSGDALVEDVQLIDVMIRASEDAHAAGVFNFMSLTPDWSRREETPTLPPHIVIGQAAVEVGMHDGGSWERRGGRSLSGTLIPAINEQGKFLVRLEEIDGQGSALDDGISVTGEWDVLANEQSIRVEGVEFDERSFSMCPQLARLWWQRMELAGRLGGVVVRHAPHEGVSVDFDLQDVALTMPIETADLWARYRRGAIEPSPSRPRMHVSSGSIRIDRDAVRLEDVVGELLSAAEGEDVVGVPYHLSMIIDQLPALEWERREEWMERTLATAPFVMRFSSDDFRVRPHAEGEPPAVELPRAVAQVLEQFGLTGWILTTELSITRDPPRPDETGGFAAQPIRSDGQAYITEASGAYHRFPYPLDDVRAHVSFDSEKVTIHYLTGEGSGGSEVRLSGTIAPPTREAAVSLRLTAGAVPVDERLRGALTGGQRRIFDAVLHQPSYLGLKQAGMLIDEEDIQAAIEQRREALAERARWRQTADPDDPAQRRLLERADREVARLDRLIRAGPFQFGGIIDLDLRIERPEGPKKRTITTGRVDIRSAGIVYERYPYPLTIVGGALDWREDEIVVLGDEDDSGLPVVAPGGGGGRLAGTIRLTKTDGGFRAIPDLTVAVADDAVNELVYAAIPPTRLEREEPTVVSAWPGAALARTAAWLRDLSVNGWLSYAAEITGGENSAFDYLVDVELTRGVAEPGAAIAEALGGEASTVADWRMEGCSGSLLVAPDLVRLERFGGRLRHGQLDLDGTVDVRRDPADIALDIRLTDMALGEHLIDVLPPDRTETARELWERYRPAGTFDAELRYRRQGDHQEPITLTVHPMRLEAIVDGRLVTFTPTAGKLHVDWEQVLFEDLSMLLSDDQGDAGTIELAGSHVLSAVDDTERLSVVGRWTDGRLRSPLIPEAMRRFGADEQAERYDSLCPRGTFDAEFSYESAPGVETGHYELRLRPRGVAVQMERGPVEIELEDRGLITFADGRILLEDLAGRHDQGVFALSGEVRTEPAIDASFRFTCTGPLTGTSLSPIMPRVVTDVFEAIELQDGDSTTSVEGELHITRPAGAAGATEPGPWRVEFTGRLDLDGASFTTGLAFSDVAGSIDVTLCARPPRSPVLDLRAALTRAEVMGQDLTDGRAVVSIAPDGGAVLLHEFRADALPGTVTAEARVGMGDDDQYEASLRLVGVPLGKFLIEPPDGDEKGIEEPDQTSGPDVAGVRPTGPLYASLDLSGRRGDPSSRIGRGVAKVLRGRLARVPLALQVLQLTQLTVPAEGLEYGEADFFIAGDRLYFESILFEDAIGDAAALQIFGDGEMNLDTFELDAYFNSRSGVLVIRDIVGGIGDALAAIHVTGPLWNPEANLVALPELNGMNPDPLTAPPLVQGREE